MIFYTLGEVLRLFEDQIYRDLKEDEARRVLGRTGFPDRGEVEERGSIG